MIPDIKVNTDELKIERIRNHYTMEMMAQLLGLNSRYTYSRKESGVSRFTPAQIIAVSETFHLSLQQINIIFFEGKLPVDQVA